MLPFTITASALLSMSPSPLLSMSPSPLLSTSPSPLLSMSPSPLLSTSPSPLLSISPSPLLSMSPSPLLSMTPPLPPYPSPKGSTLQSSLRRTKKGHRHSDRHWNSLKGNTKEIEKKWYRALMGFHEHEDNKGN